MKKKSTTKKSAAAMSPLLRALTYRRAASEPMIELMLLKCYAALDAFHRGHGSNALFMTLCQHTLIAEELCQLGHAPDRAEDITHAHEALVAVDELHASEGHWTLDDTAHARLRDALALFAMQLDAAPLEDIARAEASMVTQSLVAARSETAVRRAEMASSET